MASTFSRTLSVLLFASMFLCLTPHVTHAAVPPGCYNDDGSFAANPSANTSVNNGCPAGSYLVGPNGRTGATTPNNLSYTQLEPLPGQPNGQADFCGLLNYLFKALIYLGGGVAVLFIVLSGITYMVSEVVDNKTKARDRIRAAVIGLAVLLASWIILNTVNPQIVKACTILNPSTTGVVNTQAGTVLDNGESSAQDLVNQCRGSGGVVVSKFASIDPFLNPPVTRCYSIQPSCNGYNPIKVLGGCCDVMRAPTPTAPGVTCYGIGVL